MTEFHNKQIRRLTILKALFYLICTLTVLAIMVTLVVVVSVSISNSKSAKILVDCTTPGHQCYEQARSANSGAVGTINRSTIAAIYCSGKLGPTATVSQLQFCVLTLIK